MVGEKRTKIFVSGYFDIMVPTCHQCYKCMKVKISLLFLKIHSTLFFRLFCAIASLSWDTFDIKVHSTFLIRSFFFTYEHLTFTSFNWTEDTIKAISNFFQCAKNTIHLSWHKELLQNIENIDRVVRQRLCCSGV